MSNEQTNYGRAEVTDAGDVRLVIGSEDRMLVGAALLSSSAARKLAAMLTASADAAEKQDALNRRRDRLQVQEARLLAQLRDLQEKAAALR